MTFFTRTPLFRQIQTVSGKTDNPRNAQKTGHTRSNKSNVSHAPQSAPFPNGFYRTRLFVVLLACIIVGAGVPVQAKEGAAYPRVRCRLETERNLLIAGEAQNVVLKVSLLAPPAPAGNSRPPVNLALVLDRSGSMSGRKMDQAKEAAIEVLGRLGHRDLFSVVTYNNTIQTMVPAGRVYNTEAIRTTIEHIQAGGNTALFGGVSQGAAEIRRHLGRDLVHRIVLLSDGLANVGPSHPSDLGRLGAALVKENISVTTVGVGVDYNEDLMARLSQESDGNTYFVENSYDLPAIFAAELGDLLSITAKQVRVSIEMADGVTPIRIIGREGRIRNRRVELYMNQLYGGQEKYALVEVRVPASRPDTTLEIARGEVAYDNPYAGRRESVFAAALARYSSDAEAVAASANVEVVRDYQLNLNALAQEKAIELSDQGRPQAAVSTLKQSADTLKKMGMKYQDKTLLEEAEAIEDRALQLETQGMTKKSRKEMRTKSFQMKNQQLLKTDKE